jgi:hypothetical protein
LKAAPIYVRVVLAVVAGEVKMRAAAGNSIIERPINSD